MLLHRGAGELRVASGSLAVDSAMMDGSGTTTVASGASMTVRNAGFYGLYLSGTRALVNNGTVTLAEVDGTPYQSLLLNEAPGALRLWLRSANAQPPVT